MRTLLATGVVAAAALVPMMSVPAEAAAAVQIYRVYFDSPGKDTRSNASLNGEWVQLINRSRTSKQLKGYTLRDRTGYTYRFGTFTLKPGKTVRVRTGKGRNTSTDLYWGRRAYVWNNTGDTAYLRYPNARGADSCSWTSKGDYKYC